MKVKLYAIRDDKAVLFNAPVIMQNDSVAVRSFSDLAERDEAIKAHSGDYSIFSLGEFDNETGEFFPSTPRILARASDFSNPSHE